MTKEFINILLSLFVLIVYSNELKRMIKIPKESMGKQSNKELFKAIIYFIISLFGFYGTCYYAIIWYNSLPSIK